MRMSYSFTATQRDCRKIASSARKEIDGILFESRPRKGYSGNWELLHGKGVVIRRKRVGQPWQVYLKGSLVGNNQLTNLAECLRANAWVIKKGLM